MSASGSKKTVVIGGDGFQGNTDLSPEQMKSLVVGSINDASSLFHKWNGEVTCTLVAKLSNDNQSVEDCSCVLLGKIFNNKKTIAMNGVWENVPALQLVMGTIDSSLFTFSSGTTSDLVDSSALDYEFLIDGKSVSDEEREEKGLLGFSCRIYLVPVGANLMRMYIILYPGPLDQLAETHVALPDARFPGTKLYSGDVDLVPNPLHLFKVRWGLPVVPTLLASAPATLSLPSNADLRAAVCSTLRATIRPEVKSNFSTLNQRWLAIKEHGANQLKHTPLELIWPLNAPPAPAPRGRVFSSCFISFKPT